MSCRKTTTVLKAVADGLSFGAPTAAEVDALMSAALEHGVEVRAPEQRQHGQVGFAVPAVGGRIDQHHAVAGFDHAEGRVIGEVLLVALGFFTDQRPDAFGDRFDLQRMGGEGKG